MIHRVANVNDAVRLAEDLRTKGEYDWFRGQIQDWPLKSTLSRVPEQDWEETMAKIARFEYWFKSTRGLESIAASADMAIAVAQHYGLPTNFVDFTTDPSIAGFFASHGTPSNDRLSCLMCLNKKDLAEFWEVMKEHTNNTAPEFIYLSVPNLWRLEAQRGVFLFCPFPNFEEVYDLDRIVFPFTGPVSHPPENTIYPDRKSHLEILLDQYFMNEQLVEGTRDSRRTLTNMTILRLTGPPGKCDPELVPNGPPFRPSSWDESIVSAWQLVSPEGFAASISSETCPMTVRSTDSLATRTAMACDQVTTYVNSNPSARQTLLSWSLSIEHVAIQKEDAEEITRTLQRLWDGLRLLPYSNHQVAEGMGFCAALAVDLLSFSPQDRQDWHQIHRSFLSDSIEIEFGSEDGSYSRAYVDRSDLLHAVRDDIGKFLNPQYADQVLGNITGLLQAIQSPDRLFEFDKLADLFATRIAPVQVWMRKGTAVFYSLARLDTLGLP
jgi:hypothetical protein